MLRSLLALTMVAGLLAVPARLAFAQDVCAQKDASTGVCLWTVSDGVVDQGQPSSSSTGGSTCTTLFGKGVPCRVDDAIWSRTHSCYVLLMKPQPSPSQLDQWGMPLGEHPGEQAFSCTQSISGGSGGSYPIIWLPVAPAVDLVALARQAIAQMNLQAITIGIVPEPLPGRVGIIGFPTWMWAEAPTESTVGPISRSATAGAVTVNATATVKRIVWVMGDGSTVVCTGPGTKYEDRYGASPSPTCGYAYSRTGTYTVSATSYWDVSWTGGGSSGVIPLSFTRSTSITMGEIQVITTG